MALEESRFWDYDESKGNEYQADEFAEFHRAYFFDGVPELGDNLQVYADDSGMQVKIKDGYAVVQGTLYKLTSDSGANLTKAVPAAHASLTRIDRIVLRRDKGAATASIVAVYLPGTPAASPAPPALTREGNIHDISLARWPVAPGTLSITADMIIDEREDNDVCGLCENRATRDRLDALVTEVAGKAGITHEQAMSTITGLVAALAAKADAAATTTALAGKAASTHTHAQTEITDLVAALAAKLSTAAGAVGASNLADGSVGTAKLGTVQTITLDNGDTITYDAANNQLKLNVSGCTAVALAPIVFGTAASPPAGTYPKGTLYCRYV